MREALDRSLVERIIRLNPDMRMALDQRMASAVARDSHPIPRHDETIAPTSFGQRSQWFVNQLDRDNPFFNKTDAVRIRGQLDMDALRRAVTTLVSRHAVLRTVYRATDDGPVQVVNQASAIDLPISDIPPGPRQISELHRLLAAEQRRPFDLENGAMYRVHVFRLGPDDHVLARTNHHIAFDRWSSAIANAEFSELYRAFTAGEEPRLEPLPYQYADFAAWQRSQLDTVTIKRHLEFAQAHLAGVPQVLDLPTDRPRTRTQGHDGSSYSTSLDPNLVGRLRERARAEGATPFMMCLAGFGVLIGRYARRDQLLLGVPAAGRNVPGADALIGLFINSMVMRIDLRGDPSFSELVARVRTAALSVMSHQDLPFDVLVENLAQHRVAGRTPMFQVMLDYINTPAAKLTLGSLDLEPVAIADEASVYDINLYLFDFGDGIEARWEYRADLFDRPTVVRMSEAFASVLEAAVADPSRPVSALPLMSPEDRVRVRALGTGPRTPKPEPGSTLALIERHSRRRPDQRAVVAGNRTIRYGELWEQVTEVARRITSTCPPDASVAIRTGRSAQIVPALLGVLHSGRTAVMVDTSQPAHRLASMLAQVRVDATITTGVGDAPDVEVHDSEPGRDQNPVGAAETPAYVVFTSGSTGIPKPVALGSAGLENFVADACERYAIAPHDRVLQFASAGFDTFFEEVLPTLACGATLVMRPPALFASFAEFSRFVADHEITVLDLPTAWWHAWVDDMVRTEKSSVPEAVRLVIIGGEAARTDRWRDWRRIAGGRARLVNTYGPSETTVVVATFEPPPGWSPTTDVMPIGLPIRNTRLLVIDETGAPVPPGVPGELAVEGVPLGVGYIDGAGSTPVFEAADTGNGRYRTGDLARVSVDGIHEFLGRIDDQIKVSGIRIEPGEIEAALRSHAAIDDAVVFGVADDRGTRLVAHLASTAPVDEQSIRDHLRDRLPEAMIPGTLSIHPTFPMTTSGKVDRLALRDLTHEPPPEFDAEDLDRPATPTEQRLIRIWEAVMPKASLRLNDDFFAVGGHSLLGVRLISLAVDEFGVDVPLRMLYEAPTVARMARWIDGMLEDTQSECGTSGSGAPDRV